MVGIRCLIVAWVLDGCYSAKTVPVRRWRILGPFPVGKNELDGQPWLTSNHSELLRGGTATWNTLTANADGQLEVDWRKEVDWQGLVNGVGGHEVLEWQALAKGSLKVDVATLAILSCRGISSFSLDNSRVPLVGDQYRAGLPGAVVELTGKHSITVRLRAKIRTSLQCVAELLPGGPQVHAFPAGSFLHMPDFIDGQLASELLALPVLNAHPDKWLEGVHAVVTGGPHGTGLRSGKGYVVAPGQLFRLPLQLEAQEGTCPLGGLQLRVVGRWGTIDVQSAAVTLPTFRCRQKGQSFVFTFLDADGSIQHAAAVEPSGTSAGNVAPIVLTLHGTSISASDSADSYKVKWQGDTDYTFGVKGAWLLAPTRHGAHNWEGPGRITALSALRALPDISQRLQRPLADSKRVIFAGHSMGGHGAWLLGISARDVALGVASAASWLRKDQYADSNKVLMHDVAVPDVEPALASILIAAESEHAADAHANMLVGGMPFLVRVGDKDTTVHPWFSRRMVRSLMAAGANDSDITFAELPGKEHWWWDTEEPNDGGAVNDAQVRAFFTKCLDQPRGMPAQWEIVTFNPATTSAKWGLRVMQQLVPHRRSRVAVDFQTSSIVKATTMNARKLQWDFSTLEDRPMTLEVGLDGDVFKVPREETVISWCRAEDGGHWGECHGDVVERLLETTGPMRQLFARKTCAVVGRNDSSALRAARYVANLLVMTGDGILPILFDDDVVTSEEGAARLQVSPDRCESLLVVGAHASNRAAAVLLQSFEAYTPPLQSGVGGGAASGIRLEHCEWQGADVAAVALLPWWQTTGDGATIQRLALLAIAPDSGTAAEALSLLATPTIPPMTRQPLTNLLPDYVVLNIKEVKRKGAGGFLAAGYWDHRWRRSSASSWESACQMSHTMAGGKVRAHDEL